MLAVYGTVFLVVVALWLGYDAQKAEPRHVRYSIFGDRTSSTIVWPIKTTFFGGIFVALLTLGISFGVYGDVIGEPYLSDDSRMVALADNNTIEGHWGFLGVGYVEGTMAYVYYTQEGDGVYRFRCVDARDATVHEIPGVTPHVEKWTRHFKAPGADHLLWQSVGGTRYVFYIPPGTLRQNLDIDLH